MELFQTKGMLSRFIPLWHLQCLVGQQGSHFFNNVTWLLIPCIWTIKNLILLQNNFTTLKVCATKVETLASEFKSDPNPLRHMNLIMLTLDYHTSWGYLMALVKDTPSLQHGVIFYFSYSHFIYYHYALEWGSNNKAKFETLWFLLELARENGVSIL